MKFLDGCRQWLGVGRAGDDAVIKLFVKKP